MEIILLHLQKKNKKYFNIVSLKMILKLSCDAEQGSKRDAASDIAQNHMGRNKETDAHILIIKVYANRSPGLLAYCVLFTQSLKSTLILLRVVPMMRPSSVKSYPLFEKKPLFPSVKQAADQKILTYCWNQESSECTETPCTPY